MKEFNKVIGYDDIKIELIRIVDMMLNPNKFSELGVKTTRGLILFGNPGVGKTLMANCLIKASKRKTFTIRKDLPDGEFVTHIKKTFEKAKKEAPSIVFLDDLANHFYGHNIYYTDFLPCLYTISHYKYSENHIYQHCWIFQLCFYRKLVF